METEHYPSREAAREACEEEMKYSSMRYSDLMFESSNIHASIMEAMGNRKKWADYDGKVKTLIKKREKYKTFLKAIDLPMTRCTFQPIEWIKVTV